MENLIKSEWYVEVDKLQGVIKVKANNSAKTPICIISTPAGTEWMQATPWLRSALKKAEIITQTPELFKRACKLISQIEMNDYSEPDGHQLKNNKSLHDLKQLVEQLS